MVLLVEFIRLLGLGPCESERFESDKHWQQKRNFLNKQCQRVSKWIFTFNPNEDSVGGMGGESEFFKMKQYEVKINNSTYNNMEERRESIG